MQDPFAFALLPPRRKAILYISPIDYEGVSVAEILSGAQ